LPPVPPALAAPPEPSPGWLRRSVGTGPSEAPIFDLDKKSQTLNIEHFFKEERL
jgi:hypothetical protein